MNISNYPNEPDTYQIVVVKTGEVVGNFRLRSTAKNLLPKLKKIYKEELEIKKIK